MAKKNKLEVYGIQDIFKLVKYHRNIDERIIKFHRDLSLILTIILILLYMADKIIFKTEFLANGALGAMVLLVLIDIIEIIYLIMSIRELKKDYPIMLDGIKKIKEAAMNT